MFSKLAVFALAAASVNALSLRTPTDVRSATPLELAWDFQDSDPTFTLELAHPEFRSDFALANNVDPSSGGIRVVIPVVLPRDNQYVIRAVNVGNITQEYARTGNFFIGDTESTTGSATSSTTNIPTVSTNGLPTNTNTGASNTGTGTGTGSSSNTQTGTSTGTNTGSTTGAPTNTPQNGGNGAISAGVNVAAVVFGAVAVVGLL